MLSAPQLIRQLRQKDGFPGIEVLALLADCHIVLKTDPARESNPRLAEGNQDLALWDFHDLLFHARSTEGQPPTRLVGFFRMAERFLRCRRSGLLGLVKKSTSARPWPPTRKHRRRLRNSCGKAVPRATSTTGSPSRSLSCHAFWMVPFALCRGPAARSPSPGPSHRQVRVPSLSFIFPFTSAKGLPRLLSLRCGRARTRPIGSSGGGQSASRARRVCNGRDRSPDPDHDCRPVRPGFVEVQLNRLFADLKDAGVLTQTLYLMASGMGLGGCAIGIANIDQFEKMTGIGFHIEGAVGQFAIGRPLPPASP